MNRWINRETMFKRIIEEPREKEIIKKKLKLKKEKERL